MWWVVNLGSACVIYRSWEGSGEDYMEDVKLFLMGIMGERNGEGCHGH
jgi:hypothetical protein